MGYNPWGRKELDMTERLLCVCVCVCVLTVRLNFPWGKINMGKLWSFALGTSQAHCGPLPRGLKMRLNI